MERRLAAILAADVVGYSRLMETNEEATLTTLNAYRQVIDGLIADHRGRVFGSAGDSVIAEFASPVEAVRCAVEIQQEIEARNANLPEDRRMSFRIGVNLGDVMAEGNNLFGDGVNVAARLEALCEGGGVALSGAVHEQVQGKLDERFEDAGEHEVKNIVRPIRVWRWSEKATAKMPAVPTGTEALPLPDKPSIAVLPFTNMSGDPEQEYFSDGITEDIITELSRFRDLFVIARHSSFSYKGKTVKVQEIATDLGVRYILDGSVQSARNRMRITTQLIDAQTGHQIWAERYNRDLADLFALQDQITQTVASTVADRLKVTAEDRAARKPIENLEAYDFVLRGQGIIGDTKENNLRARQAYERAIELDPTCTRAYVGVAQSHVIDWFSTWGEGSIGPSLDQALEYVAKAVSLDNTDSRAQLLLGCVLMERVEFEQAKVHLERALELNPNDADAVAYMGVFLEQTGEFDQAIDCYATAMRLNPFYPAWYLWQLGVAYYHAKRYVEALMPLKEAISRNPKFMRPRRTLAATYAQLGHIEEARTVVEEILVDQPHASLKQERELYFRPNKTSWDLEHWLEGLRKAGLPE